MNSTKEGLVVREQSGFYWVETDDFATYTCRLRGKLKEEAQASDLCAIGDRVTFTPLIEEGVPTQNGTIEAVHPRLRVLSRAVRTEGKRGAGNAEREHILIANPEQACFVVAPSHPAPNFRMLDRLLVVAEKAEMEHIIIVVNKADLETREAIDATFAPYSAMGYEVLHTSATQGIGIDALRERLRGRVSVFTGQSGVGKTSLLNGIQPNLGRVVKPVSDFSEEGMHTTRDSALIRLDVGGYLADTPGIRTMRLWDIEPNELDGYFRDIRAHVGACRFNNCTHTNEPFCAVRRAVKQGALARSRYDNYLHLREELKETYIVY